MYLHFLAQAATRHTPVVGSPLFFRTSASSSVRRERSRIFCSLESRDSGRARFFLVTSFESTSRSFTRATGDCIADDARRASPIKRAESSARRRRHGEFVFADLPSSFFLPRYLRLPDICTHHAAEARPRHAGEREREGRHLYAAPFVHGRMRGECSSRRDSAARYIHRFDENVFIIRFLSLFSPPPFFLAFSIDR